MEIIKYLYDLFNRYYYDGDCIPEYDNLELSFNFLEEDAPNGTEGKTDFQFNEDKDSAEITIKIRKELTQKNSLLPLAAVLLHEMVHAYLIVNYIFEFNEDKTELIHGEQFKNVALAHGLKDGFILPADEIVELLGGLHREGNTERKGAGLWK